ncbi:hypothetical protein XELAEV_18022214mg [Xenopus laevis]|uniref:Platelet-derived growth factor (PDGF) family profile domain-containing protein n=1 Tax=Xenopus laevis TaxID=8355 RepID=A0A974HNG9_XENLA|nr:hypothetical protein XELAEV_18022214mg [Xenopus laevis]
MGVKGLSWVDIYNRSQCQPRWILLNLLSEFPQFSDFLFIPPCVSVLRCAGCCLDEALGCAPLQTSNITMQVNIIKISNKKDFLYFLSHVIKTKSLQSDLTNLSITQHVSCQCRPKNNVRLKAHSLYIAGEKKVKKRRRKLKNGNGTPQADGSPCPPCNKHRTLNPVTCECICNITEEKCLLQGRQFHKERCSPISPTHIANWGKIHSFGNEQIFQSMVTFRVLSKAILLPPGVILETAQLAAPHWLPGEVIVGRVEKQQQGRTGSRIATGCHNDKNGK